MARFKQTRQKETQGMGMSNVTESRVIDAEEMPVTVFLSTELVDPHTQIKDWSDDPLPNSVPDAEKGKAK